MIKGNMIYLRPIQKNDITYLNKWKNDEETYMYLGGGFMPTSIDLQEKWLDSLIDTTGNNKWFIVCDYNDKPLGMIGLYNINWIHRTCEIGIFIGDHNALGKGYGKEACKILENFAKEYINIRKIKLSVVSDNEHAINMWLSLGYKKIGEHIQDRYIKGSYRNVTIMEKFIAKD